MQAFLKRLFDILISIMGLIVFSPLFIVLAFMVKRGSNGPILYKQKRVGRYGHPFYALKFRTMQVVDEDDGITSSAKQKRITKSGAVMRKYRFDELPQFWNVLVGDMSIVGPRPQIPKYIPYYPAIYEQILSVRPGITGLATIKFHETEERMLATAGNNAEDIYTHKILPKKFRYDLLYTRTANICLDIAIIWWTLCGIVNKTKADEAKN